MPDHACPFCGCAVTPRDAYRKVTGWERVHRPAGGTNAIKLREPLEVFACRPCIDLQASGISVGQGTLG